MLIVRPESLADADQIRAVHAAAFPGPVEALLVDELRVNGHATIALVAELDGRVVGHIVFSPVALASASDTRTHLAGLGLAPVAVLPEFQRCGIGSQLVAAGLESCHRLDVDYVVVLGEPEFYRRFGFAPARTANLRDEYGGGDSFLVCELCKDSLHGAEGTVSYGAEFARFASLE